MTKLYMEIVRTALGRALGVPVDRKRLPGSVHLRNYRVEGSSGYCPTCNGRLYYAGLQGPRTPLDVAGVIFCGRLDCGFGIDADVAPFLWSSAVSSLPLRCSECGHESLVVFAVEDGGIQVMCMGYTLGPHVDAAKTLIGVAGEVDDALDMGDEPVEYIRRCHISISSRQVVPLKKLTMEERRRIADLADIDIKPPFLWSSAVSSLPLRCSECGHESLVVFAVEDGGIQVMCMGYTLGPHVDAAKTLIGVAGEVDDALDMGDEPVEYIRRCHISISSRQVVPLKKRLTMEERRRIADLADIDIKPEPLSVGPGGIHIPTDAVTSRNVGELFGGALKHEAFGGLLGEDYGSNRRGNPENLRAFDTRRRHYESRYVVYQALASVIKNGGTSLWVWDARLVVQHPSIEGF